MDVDPLSYFAILNELGLFNEVDIQLEKELYKHIDQFAGHAHWLDESMEKLLGAETVDEEETHLESFLGGNGKQRFQCIVFYADQLHPADLTAILSHFPVFGIDEDEKAYSRAFTLPLEHLAQQRLRITSQFHPTLFLVGIPWREIICRPYLFDDPSITNSTAQCMFGVLCVNAIHHGERIEYYRMVLEQLPQLMKYLHFDVLVSVFLQNRIAEYGSEAEHWADLAPRAFSLADNADIAALMTRMAVILIATGPTATQREEFIDNLVFHPKLLRAIHKFNSYTPTMFTYTNKSCWNVELDGEDDIPFHENYPKCYAGKGLEDEEHWQMYAGTYD